MDQGLRQRFITIGQVDILADHGDIDLLPRIINRADHFGPLRQVRARLLQPEFFQHDVAESLFMQGLGDLIDVVHIDRRDDRGVFHIGKQGDLPAHGLRQGPLGAAQQAIRLNANRAQFLDGMLRGLGFELARRRHMGDQG